MVSLGLYYNQNGLVLDALGISFRVSSVNLLDYPGQPARVG